ncbi:MAG TPA: isoprenylcysteine carboxylmethyltransferase family protein [Burkholderiaceae bacterium]|nr:isoprenylcysteine carboxylmethyltransferase family protein [Burkholderiaceae bacterium]
MAALGFLYGLLVYVFFLATFVYAIGFVGNLPLLPRTIDTGSSAPLVETLIVDLGLLGAFALQHSVMARRGFKRWWTRLVPESVERSTFVLAATAVLALLLWQWRPIAEPVIWHVENPIGRVVLHLLFWAGWAVLLISTFLINHFELFGVRQVFGKLAGRGVPAPEFRTPGFYRHVRHPIYLGFVIAFWATPQMSAGHLLFAIATTGYILVGIWFEERDLIEQFGARYRVYRAQVGMLLPRLRKGSRHSQAGH